MPEVIVQCVHAHSAHIDPLNSCFITYYSTFCFPIFQSESLSADITTGISLEDLSTTDSFQSCYSVDDIIDYESVINHTVTTNSVEDKLDSTFANWIDAM